MVRLADMEKQKDLSDLAYSCQQTLSLIEGLQAQITNPETGRLPNDLSDIPHLIQALKDELGQSADVSFRKLGYKSLPQSQLIYISELADANQIAQDVLKPLSTIEQAVSEAIDSGPTCLTDLIEQSVLTLSVSQLTTRQSLEDALLRGQTIVVFEGFKGAYACSTASPKTRSVGKTSVENVLRGPLDAFTEAMSTNLSLIRERVRDPQFRVQYLTVGRGTETQVVVASIAGRVNPSMLARVIEQISAVDVDAIVDSGQLAQLMHPGWLHIFPLSIATERPDRVVMGLFDGRVAVIVDTSPFVVLLPSLYVDFFQAMEDLYMPWIPAAVMRLLRLVADHVAVLAPAGYICVTAFNPGIMVPQFELVLASSRALVPYSPLVEMLLVLALTDVLIEATIRSPKVVGNAVPIVGGIIIGDVLVKTHLASEVALVIGALAAITQFTAAEPSIQTIERANKYWFVLWSGYLGFMGFMIATVLELGYMSVIESVGVPYLSPISPLRWRELFNSKLVLPPKWRPRRGTKGNF